MNDIQNFLSVSVIEFSFPLKTIETFTEERAQMCNCYRLADLTEEVEDVSPVLRQNLETFLMSNCSTHHCQQKIETVGSRIQKHFPKLLLALKYIYHGQ